MHLLACARASERWFGDIKVALTGASARVSRLHKGAKVEHEGALKGKMLGGSHGRTEKLGRFFVASLFAARRHRQHFLFSAPSFNSGIFYSSFSNFFVNLNQS
jgi:hypothetical protein